MRLTRRQLRRLITESFDEQYEFIKELIMSGEVDMGVELLMNADPGNARPDLGRISDELWEEMISLNAKIKKIEAAEKRYWRDTRAWMSLPRGTPQPRHEDYPGMSPADKKRKLAYEQRKEEVIDIWQRLQKAMM